MGNPERELVSKDACAVTPGRNSKERPRSRSRTSRRGRRRASVGDAGARRERHAGRAPSEAGVMCRAEVPEEAGAGRSAARRRARGAALEGRPAARPRGGVPPLSEREEGQRPPRGQPASPAQRRPRIGLWHKPIAHTGSRHFYLFNPSVLTPYWSHRDSLHPNKQPWESFSCSDAHSPRSRENPRFSPTDHAAPRVLLSRSRTATHGGTCPRCLPTLTRPPLQSVTRKQVNLTRFEKSKAAAGLENNIG